MVDETLSERSTYRAILAAAEAVQRALEAKATANFGVDEGMHAACAVRDADHAAMAIRSLVELYEPAPRA